MSQIKRLKVYIHNKTKNTNISNSHKNHSYIVINKNIYELACF